MKKKSTLLCVLLLIAASLAMNASSVAFTAMSMLAQGITPIAWETTAAGFNGKTGQIYNFRCPEGGTRHTVWGSDTYTADSSICTAAVHSGLINLSRGGVVTIEIRPGRQTYGSTTRNGIKTTTYGEYARSYVFRGVPSAASKSSEVADVPANNSDMEEEATPIDWSTSAAGFSGEAGQTYTLQCPAGGTKATVWGSEIYTADSSICTAAVHKGLITTARGGIVTIEIRPGKSIYGSTTRNGVKTNSYGEYGRSYVFK